MANVIVPGLPILPGTSNLGGAAGTGSCASCSGSSAGTNGTGSTSDRTQLSADGNLLGATVQALKAAPSTRNALVASLRQRIAAGTYNPDMNAIASAVVKALRSSIA